MPDPTLIRPTFVVALGGTGTDIVKHLQTRLMLRYGTSELPTLKYLFLDTDATNNKILTNRPDIAFSLFPKDDKVFKLMNEDSEDSKTLQLGRWMSRSLWSGLSPQSFSQGVQGKRMYGRLAFLSAETLPQISNFITNTLTQLKGYVGDGAAGLNQDASIRIIVVASAGGGTGSGTFLDMGYFLRHLIARANLISSCSIEGVAAIAVSEAFSSREYTQNSLALIEELEYFSQANNVFQAHYVDADLRAEIGLQRPYDYPFLVSPVNHDTQMASNSKEALDQLKWKIADYLFLRTVDEGGTNGIGARMPDMITNFGETSRLNGESIGHFDGLGYPLTFMTVGVSLRQLPSELADRHDKRLVRADFVERWLKKAEVPKETLAEAVLDRTQGKDKLFIPGLKEEFLKDMKDLREQLGLLQDHEMGAKPVPERAIRSDHVADYLIQPEKHKDALAAALKKDAEAGEVDSAFAYKGGPLEPHLPGYVEGTIVQNLKGLLSADSAIKAVVWKCLWDAAADFERGPRYALLLIEELVKRMDDDTRLMEDALKIPLPAANAYKILNVKFKQSLLNAKKTFYENVRRELKGMSSSNVDTPGSVTERLKYLIRYVEAWQKDGEKGSEAEQSLYERARAEMKPSVLAMPERSKDKRLELQQRIGADTVIPLIEWARAEEFVPGLPRTAGGDTSAIQFKAFSTLDKRLQLLRQESGGMPTVLEQLEKECAEDWSTEAIRELNESRVMLNLNLSASDYGDMLGTDRVPRAFKWFALVNRAQGAAVEGRTVYNRYRDAVNSKFTSYADLTKGGRTALEWEEGFSNTDLLALVSLRASFPTRIISHYHADTDRPRLIRDNEMPYTQIGIMRPIGQEQLRRAEKCLLVGEIFARCQKLEKRLPNIISGDDGTTHLYTYRPIDKDVNESWEYSKNYGSAVGDLARKLEVIKALENDINVVLSNGQVEGALKDEIIEHLEALRELGGKPGQGIGDYPRLDLWDMPYREVQNVLQAWMTGQNWSVPNDMHRWAEPDGTQWRCRNCQNVYAIKPDFPKCKRCGFSG